MTIPVLPPPGITQDDVDEAFKHVHGLLDVLNRVIRRQFPGRAVRADIHLDPLEEE